MPVARSGRVRERDTGSVDDQVVLRTRFAAVDRARPVMAPLFRLDVIGVDAHPIPVELIRSPRPLEQFGVQRWPMSLNRRRANSNARTLCTFDGGQQGTSIHGDLPPVRSRYQTGFRADRRQPFISQIVKGSAFDAQADADERVQPASRSQSLRIHKFEQPYQAGRLN